MFQMLDPGSSAKEGCSTEWSQTRQEAVGVAEAGMERRGHKPFGDQIIPQGVPDAWHRVRGLRVFLDRIQPCFGLIFTMPTSLPLGIGISTP